ncbi:Omega-6 fatty acid desaturase, endoplasmic reticulum isozyme 2 [Porphyridium purpureum]|uniref:Omega-6 fatty acid desaturase, endoplasmic reticulum isozyme 2 n=1 Tax=Porphyridium purpureum TaxID=35688 RepID=A0A5J4YW35_PORPP|nr:Omega-6 fatty acid desaturase, endoplasmic reticulum isozyme 2 [Porphyridium purpureum]|eukprot:POR5461..scf209_3
MPEKSSFAETAAVAKAAAVGQAGDKANGDVGAEGARGDAALPAPLGEDGRRKAVEAYRQPYVIPDTFPEKSQVHAAIPAHCFERSLWKSMSYAALSVFLTVAFPILAWKVLPVPSWSNPLSVLAWAVFAFWQGTIATGCWVVAHECGHRAFCDSNLIQDAVGFVLHSALLVPYFSWQRSHAVHHSRTNHMSQGETHVPAGATTKEGAAQMNLERWIGEDAFAIVNLFNHLVLGWPMYLMTGATGSPERGFSNHFVPTNGKLFPDSWKWKVLLSDVGILVTLALLFKWAQVAGTPQVLVLYAFPYLFTNMWLVLYTWLQHTDVDVPHYEDKNWTWIKGAFMTVDRPYPEPFDFLHHRIGSTHVAHHLFSTIPHYHAREATEAVKQAFPEHYLYDPTPIVPALWRVAAKCVATVPEGNRQYYTYVNGHGKAE